MRKITEKIIIIFLMGMFTFVNSEEVMKVKGLPNERNTLDEYTEKGKKLERLESVDSQEIEGHEVLGKGKRGLVKVEFRGKERWLRTSQLELTLPSLPPCPKKAVGESKDRVTPVSSGSGGRCK